MLWLALHVFDVVLNGFYIIRDDVSSKQESKQAGRQISLLIPHGGVAKARPNKSIIIIVSLAFACVLYKI